MKRTIIIIMSLIYIYYHIGGLATTNILRLTKGNDLPINASRCVCDSCGAKIPVFLQLPIISYIICHGKCMNCKVHIPICSLILEISIILGMIILTTIFDFAPIGVFFSFLFYEIIRLITIIIMGNRETGFAKQYVVAVLSMLPFLLITLFVSIIYTAV